MKGFSLFGSLGQASGKEVGEVFRSFIRSYVRSLICGVMAAEVSMYGVPKRIRFDNGPEFISVAIKTWLAKLGVDVLYIELGSPWQSGLCESFNSRLRNEYLHQTDLISESDARIQARAWRDDYNNHRPHSSLGYLTPSEFARRVAASASVAALPSFQQHCDPLVTLTLTQPNL